METPHIDIEKPFRFSPEARASLLDFIHKQMWANVINIAELHHDMNSGLCDEPEVVRALEAALPALASHEDVSHQEMLHRVLDLFSVASPGTDEQIAA